MSEIGVKLVVEEKILFNEIVLRVKKDKKRVIEKIGR